MLGIVLLALLAAPQDVPAPALGAPPWVAWPTQSQISPSAHAAHALIGVVELSTERRRVTISWSWDDAASGGRVFGSQVFETDYWPTAAEELGEELVVCGVRSSNGNTVIERWTFSYPAPPADPAQPYVAVLAGTTTLHDARVPGRSGVRLLREVRGVDPAAAPQALAYFVDSRALVQLDAATGAIVHSLYAPQQFPALDTDAWQSMRVIEHAKHGYVYVLCKPLDGDYAGGIPVLFDLDRDSVIDQCAELTDQEWEALMGDPSTWTAEFPI